MKNFADSLFQTAMSLCTAAILCSVTAAVLATIAFIIQALKSK